LQVPCLIDNSARLAMDESEGNEGRLLTKPHGHGDVHVLMHTTGTAQRWLDGGKELIYIFQDTNALSGNAIAMLGMCATLDDEFAGTCMVPSLPHPRASPKRRMLLLLRCGADVCPQRGEKCEVYHHTPASSSAQ